METEVCVSSWRLSGSKTIILSDVQPYIGTYSSSSDSSLLADYFADGYRLIGTDSSFSI